MDFIFAILFPIAELSGTEYCFQDECADEGLPLMLPTFCTTN
jgi:hypothetical protein